MKTFVLNDVESDVELSLSYFQETPDSEGLFTCRAAFCCLGAEAACEIEDYEAGNWSAYFEEIAVNWKGRSDEMRSRTYQDSLGITATADHFGHIVLTVALRTAVPPVWAFEASITLESGQLDAIASQVKAFFGEPRRYTSHLVEASNPSILQAETPETRLILP
jgi:hypothetical protein